MEGRIEVVEAMVDPLSGLATSRNPMSGVGCFTRMGLMLRRRYISRLETRMFRNLCIMMPTGQVSHAWSKSNNTESGTTTCDSKA